MHALRTRRETNTQTPTTQNSIHRERERMDTYIREYGLPCQGNEVAPVIN